MCTHVAALPSMRSYLHAAPSGHLRRTICVLPCDPGLQHRLLRLIDGRQSHFHGSGSLPLHPFGSPHQPARLPPGSPFGDLVVGGGFSLLHPALHFGLGSQELDAITIEALHVLEMCQDPLLRLLTLAVDLALRPLRALSIFVSFSRRSSQN